MKKPACNIWKICKWFFLYLVVFLISVSLLLAFIIYNYNKKSSDLEAEKTSILFRQEGNF